MIRPTALALLAVLALPPVPAGAQAMVQAVPGTTTADQLAQQMRLLGSNANDLNALLAAGELSLKLDDLGAAASFFARAERVDPRNGRAKAGQGAILVHAERPGEALRYFATAESFGLQPALFASERGLAYDLIGEQERAQRDYRLALRTPGAASEDETRRRYALSLGISGKRDLADQQLQSLIAKKDRGAWRARAFVEAMTGNIGEATRIATTMMPPGTAAGLQPFLQRLPTLGAVDRAFAVHFGEVRGTPQRLADARLAPAMAALGPDPYAPRGVALAVATPAPDKGKRKGKKGREPVALAAAPVAAPTTAPTPAAVPIRTAAPTLAAAAPVTARPAPVAATVVPRPAVPSATPPAVIAAASPMRSTLPPPAERDVRVASGSAPLSVAGGAASIFGATAARVVAPPPPVASVVNAMPATRSAPPVATTAPTPAFAAAARLGEPAAASSTPLPAAVARSVEPVAGSAAAPSAPAARVVAATPAPVPTATAAPTVLATARPPAPERRDGLASIINGLSIPAAELGIAGPHRAAPVVTLDEGRATDAPDPAAERLAAERAAAERATGERAAAARALADRKAADRKAAADKKALAEKKAAAEKKAEEAREAAAQKKLERANPERIWVQVAGGAYAGDLPKAWAAAKKKGGDAFAGHATGWTTPLRFTNRVLAGPFKTDADARAFVNDLKAKGMSGFTFTSEAGQVVKKLGADE